MGGGSPALLRTQQPEPTSQACDLENRTGPRAQKNPQLGLITYCHHLEILDFLTRSLHLHFVPDPQNYAPVVLVFYSCHNEVYNKRGGLKQKCIISQVWRPGVQNQGVSRVMFPLKPVGEDPFLPILEVASNPWCSFSSLWLHYHTTVFSVCLCLHTVF